MEDITQSKGFLRMGNQDILAKANEYISLEQDGFFRRQVEALVA
jgi:hypothetical protein